MGGQLSDDTTQGTSRQRVLVTGGASGIGMAMAEAFLADGARVHVADIAGRPPDGATMTHTDVADEGSVDGLFAAVGERLGGLDVLCNNVGIAGPTGPIEDLDVGDWDRTMAVNVRSMFLLCRRAVPAMRQAGGGSILNTASTAGITGYPMRSPYAASKWAVVGLGETLAMELGELGIRVNTICPGSVGGERMNRVIAAEAATTGATEDQIRTGYENQVSMRTFVDAEDIAAMAVFLASPAARFVNGQTISVDGGLETLRNTWRT
ncbi:MAG: SDR family oxidoreductase [Acidimicrobiia bacterium]|nr:SDR family oxidoreductase [Actinomycetota bacterium]MBL6924365.1 SDR family oxidoreductase [Acidimicrobiia bacterium]MBL6926636.1 SDR family oxidoreductase [Acidimicrobiia bacterium]